MAEKENSYNIQNVKILKNSNISGKNNNMLKGMIGKINQQIKTWTNNFKKSTNNYIQILNDKNITNFINIYINANKTYKNFDENLKSIKNKISISIKNNNILDGLYSNSENNLRIFKKRIIAQKDFFIKDLKLYIENNYNQTLRNYIKILEDINIKINTLNVLTNNASNNNLINRKKIITNIFESKKKTGEKIIKNKNSYRSLKNELKEIIELKNMNQTYNNLFNTIEPLGNNKKNNINSKIKTRSENYQKNIIYKTSTVEELINTMQEHIDELQEKITNSTVFSNESKRKMEDILKSLEISKKEGSQDFKNEIKRLTDIMNNLKKLIGEGNNKNNLLNIDNQYKNYTVDQLLALIPNTKNRPKSGEPIERNNLIKRIKKKKLEDNANPIVLPTSTTKK